MKKSIHFCVVCLFPFLMLSCGSEDEPNAGGNSGGSQQSGNHDFVDLGLTSGTLWATTNIGAQRPYEVGGYFAWGETAQKSIYDWNTYKWCNGDYNKLTKYCSNSSFGKVDNKTELDLADDAAYVNWGSKWRMPSQEQLDELRVECNWQWTSMNGVNGYLVKSKRNDVSMFLPAAGWHYASDLISVGTNAIYWSRTLYTDNPECACSLFFDSNNVDPYYWSKSGGRSVRAVRVSQ